MIVAATAEGVRSQDVSPRATGNSRMQAGRSRESPTAWDGYTELMLYSRKIPLLVAIPLSVAVLANRSQADALIVTRAMKASTIAEIFVEDDVVRLEIEVGIADWKTILPDDLADRLSNDVLSLRQKLAEHVKLEWSLVADDQQLVGEIIGVDVGKRVVRDEVTGEPLPQKDGDAELVIRAELCFTLTDRPQTL